MIKDYQKYTEYTRYVDLKKTDFVIQFVREYFTKTNPKGIEGLDLGCGRGNITFPLAAIGYRMIGGDISADEIRPAKSKQIINEGVAFLVCDAENAPFKRKAFDFSVCSEVLEHLRHPKKTLTSMQRCIRGNGLLIITIPNGYGPFSLIFDHFRNKVVSRIFRRIGPSSHIQVFTLSKIINLIQESGFEILNIKHSDFLSFFPILVRSKRFSYYDCKLADKLPSLFVSGYYIACRRREYSDKAE